MARPARPILVVEDRDDIREGIVQVLEADGYRTVVATNGQQALTRLQSGERPCLILLDLMMPVMNGEQFREAQLRDPTLRDIPVAVFSAREGRGAALGIDSVAKPLDVDGLLRLVERNAAAD